MKKTQQIPDHSSTVISNIPDGYTVGTRPDGQKYLVPQYMVPALDHAFASYRNKAELKVSDASGGVSEYLASSM